MALHLKNLLPGMPGPPRQPGDFLSAGVLYATFVAALFFLFQPTLIHDAIQYYAYVASILLDGDLDLYNQLYLHNAWRTYNPFPWESARYAGTAIMESPFFLIAHGIARGLQTMGWPVATHGYSSLYLVLASLASPLWGVCGIIICYWLARAFFGRAISLAAAWAGWLASPAVFFMFLWNGWPHPFALFWVAAFILLWQRTRGHRSSSQWGLLGVFLGLGGLTQPSSVLVVVFPLVEGAAHWHAWRTRPDGRRQAIQYAGGLAVCAIASLLAFSPQFTLWRVTSGSWFSAPYASVGDAHHWFKPHLVGLLFDTARHGLLAWSPLLLPAFLGQLYLFRRDRVLALAALAFSLLTLYVYACWSIWWSGVGFSNRFFIHLAPVYILGLAALIDWLRSRHVPWAAILAALAGFVFLNLLWMAAYRALLIPHGIPEPSRAMDVIRTWPRLCALLLGNIPPLLQSLMHDQWANHTWFASRIYLAMHSGNLADLIFQAGCFALTAGLLVAGLHLCWKKVATPRAGGYGWPWVAAGLLLLLIIHGLLFRAGSRRGSTGSVCRLETLDQEALAAGPPVVLFTEHPEPVNQVDIISGLAFSHAIPQGAEVAEVTLEDINGVRLSTHLRAGIDTAEQSFHRREHRELMRHGINQTKVVRHVISRDFSDSYHELLLFHFPWKLPQPTPVKSISIRFLHPFGRLYLSDVFLRSPAGFSRARRTGTCGASLPPVNATQAWCLTAAHPVKDVARDAQGRIYAATWGGLAVYSPEGQPLYKQTRADGWPTHILTSICVTPDDTVWVGSLCGLVQRSTPLRIFTEHDGLNSPLIYSLAHSDGLGLLVGTGRGVNRRSGVKFIPLDDEHEFARRKVYDMQVDAKGGAWFAKEAGLTHFAKDARLAVFRRDILQRVPPNAPIRNELFCVATDLENRPWVGTRQGVSWYDGTGWYSGPGTSRSPSDTNQPLAGHVVSLAFDTAGRLWMAHGNACNQGVSCWDDGRWCNVAVADGMPTGAVYKIRELGANLWLATEAGAGRLANRTLFLLPSQDDLPDNAVRAITMDSNQVITIECATGIAHVEGRRITVDPTRHSSPAPVSSAAITLPGPWMENIPLEAGWEPTCVLPDNRNGYWVGTRSHGVWHMRDGNWRELTLHGQRLPVGITALLQPAPAQLWVGTACEGALCVELPEGPP